VRAFVAVFPPPEVQEALHRAALALPSSDAFRLTAPEKIHLTLTFLGEVSEEALGRAKEALGPAREGHEPVEVATSSFGVFPSERKARVLWAGIGEGSERLRDLAGDVESGLAAAGFEQEARSYVPHMTLGRDEERARRWRGHLLQPGDLRSLEGRDQGADGHDDEEEYQDHNDYGYEVTPAHPIRTSG
jgi:2'-5' RNA ligase